MKPGPVLANAAFSVWGGPRCGWGSKASLWWCHETDVHDTAYGSRWRMHWHDARRLWEAAHQKVSKGFVERLHVVTVGSLIPSSVNMVEIRRKGMGILELEHIIELRSDGWLASHLWRWDEKIAYSIQFLYFPASLLLSFQENCTLLDISSVRSAAQLQTHPFHAFQFPFSIGISLALYHQLTLLVFIPISLCSFLR